MEQTLTEKQIRTIRLIRNRGRELANEHPEIAEDYRCGDTALQIAERYIPNFVSPHVASGIVHEALFRLLEDGEKRELAKEHIIKASMINGLECKLNKTGLFSQTPDEFKRASRKGVLRKGYIPFDIVRETEYGELSEKDFIIRLRVEDFSYDEITKRANDIFCQHFYYF